MPPKPPKKQSNRSSSNQNNFVKITPAVKRFFYICEEDIDLSVKQLIPANNFTNDQGILVTGFPYKKPNGYNNLFINGLMQQGSIYSISTKGLTINAVSGTIFAGTPIIIEMVDFYLN
ncbi:DUF4183 domain-containing protein [Bacillus marasmi]|uniref:DUF4183 domain-containing protein n=1 Tax=Bacillus marasmi TaxID=1926279 RepID=UPI0011C94ABF|nr:DUF4183 domain-containing protein [Bacillus marasmi]